MRRQIHFLAGCLLSSLLWGARAEAVAITSGPSADVFLTSVTVRWTTDVACDTWLLRAAGSGAENLADVYNAAPTLTHQATLQDLLPGTTYFLTVQSKTQGPLTANAQFPITLQSVNPSAPVDFTLSVVGGRHVVQGHGLYAQFSYTMLAGPGTRGQHLYHFAIDPPPAGLSVESTSSSPYELYEPTGGFAVYIAATTGMAPGSYPIHFTLQSIATQLKKEFVYTVQVDVPPALPSRQTISTIPAIPNLAEWEMHMTTGTFAPGMYGGKHWCDEPTILAGSTWEGGVWYYDGARVFYQIADYTKDKSWEQCAGYVLEMYRDSYLLPSGTTGWRVFPHGMYMNYERTGDSRSYNGIVKLAVPGFPLYSLATPLYMREAAYKLDAQLTAMRIGVTGQTIDRTIDMGLSQFDSIFVTKSIPYYKPFMIGLMMEAMIDAYSVTKDPRLLQSVQTAADWLWANAYQPQFGAFYYESVSIPTADSVNLNLLIAPAYAWLWAQTGDPKYQQRGDLLFSNGVLKNWFGQGKEFSQNYRWSFAYVQWRTHPESLTTLPVRSVCDVNGDAATNVADAQICVNQTLGNAACTADVNHDGKCNVLDIQRVVNAALGGSCVTTP